MSIEFIHINDINDNVLFPWECSITSFEKYYDINEVCYIKKGRAKIQINNSSSIEVKKGDTFRILKGTSCKWEILEDIYKEYYFEK